MDMDIDMDIPLPEELEWLEANASHFDDDLAFHEEDYEIEPPEDGEEAENDFLQSQPPTSQQKPTKPTLSIPSKPTPFPPQATQITAKKRFRSAAPDSPNPEILDLIEEKRSRIEVLDRDLDGDGIGLLPPRENEVTHVDQEEEDVVVVVEEEEEKFIYRYASEIDGDFVPVTGPGGERVYAKICRFEVENRLKKLDVKSRNNGLIAEPINVLMQRVEHDGFTKALQASVGSQSDASVPETPTGNEQLWVDKYAPNSFSELLSDEKTNREVLLWLKQWDSCVFGSEIKSTRDDVLSALRRHSSVSQHQKPSNRSSFNRNRETIFLKETHSAHSQLHQENTDSKGIQELWNKKHKGYGPPEQKILLLCGPPGLGKTTLAHVAARHCGYRVVEINASDDRSASTIEAKILDVVQMNSVMADSKPKCLVIDEIDGALGDGKGAVEVILKMLSAEKKSDIGKENIAKEDFSGKKSSKKKQKHSSLLRPVICICNDLYAPALRPLRHVAKVHVFVQPTVNRVVSRLKYICNKEGLKTSSIALTALAEYTECDIRSCLNTLQFLNKKKENLNVLDISSQVVGHKDTSKNVFDIWKEIFQKRRLKRDRKIANNSSSTSHGFDFLHSLIANRGDYDLIIDGMHENMLLLPYHDPVMQKTVKCLRSLAVSDIIHQYIMRTQQMSLQVYQPPVAVSIHHLIAQVEKTNIEWPKSFQRYRTTLMEKTDILHSWKCKMLPSISRHLSTKSFIEDSISPLLHILSPPTLRPVAVHLLSEKEKDNMAQLVNTMISYAITYRNINSGPLLGAVRQEVAVDASALLFDPPIGDFIGFKGYASGHFVLPLAVKQVLVHEVEKQKILLDSSNKSMPPTDLSRRENQRLVGDEIGSAKTSRSHFSAASVEKAVNREEPLNKKQLGLAKSSESQPSTSTASVTTNVKLRTENTRKPSKSSSSFFDRFKKSSGKGIQNRSCVAQNTATTERDARPLLFKFNEGFTNAVKRPVRIREFLP